MTEPNSIDSLSATISGDGAIVIAGDIDMAGGPILELAIAEREAQLAADGADHKPSPGDVVLDMAGVFFIDSSGLRSLLSATRRAGERGGKVVLRSVGPEVTRLLEITGTLDHFDIESQRD